jgi:hypothetical protein
MNTKIANTELTFLMLYVKDNLSADDIYGYTKKINPLLKINSVRTALWKNMANGVLLETSRRPQRFKIANKSNKTILDLVNENKDHLTEINKHFNTNNSTITLTKINYSTHVKKHNIFKMCSKFNSRDFEVAKKVANMDSEQIEILKKMLNI